MARVFRRTGHWIIWPTVKVWVLTFLCTFRMKDATFFSDLKFVFLRFFFVSNHKRTCTHCNLWITDVDDVKFVINYDFPNSSEDYIHRIGRTGRSSKKGVSYAFFTRNNSRLAKDLVNVLKEANQKINPDLAEMASYGKDFDHWNFLDFISFVFWFNS